MPFRAPDPIAYIFDGHLIQPENVALDPEGSDAVANGNGMSNIEGKRRTIDHRNVRMKVIARALDGFIFVKDGRFVYPTYGVPDEWWQGVVAYGYVAALTGEFKYFIWAGQWHMHYDDKHLEVVILANLQGLSKEINKHWRNGKEHILWLDTDQGYSYALLEPAEEYDRGGWTRVTSSWTSVPDPECSGDPSFCRIQPQDVRPEWWDGNGDDAWDHFQGRPEQTPQLDKAQPAPPVGPWAASKKGAMNKKPVEHLLVDAGSSDEEGSVSRTLVRKSERSKAGEDPTEGKRDGRGETNLQPVANKSVRRGNRVVSPINVESSSSDEGRCPTFKPVRKGVANKCANTRNLKTKSTTKPPAIPSKRRPLKCRVVSGPSNPCQRQIRKTVEPIYVDSGSSDDENPAPSSSPRPPTPSDASGAEELPATRAPVQITKSRDTKLAGSEAEVQQGQEKEGNGTTKGK
ncbi:hypothetical protein FRC11_005325 [Ceratobasidium sp. 423]|nr:hypothetical protein FRC11_005325 [Ceratobasidium sp. 423]